MDRRPHWPWLALLAGVIALSPSFAAGQSERERAAERRAVVVRDLDVAAGEKAELQTRAARLERDLARLRAELNRSSKAMRVRRRATAAAAEAAAEAETQALAAEAAIDLRRRELAGLLGAMARLSRRPPEALAAWKDGPEEAAKASLALKTLLPEIGRRIDEARAALDEAARLKAAHLDRLTAAEAARAELNAERKALDKAVAAKRRLIRRNRANDAVVAKRMAKLAAEADDIDTFVKAMAAREAAAAAARASQASVAKARGLEAAHRHAFAARPQVAPTRPSAASIRPEPEPPAAAPSPAVGDIGPGPDDPPPPPAVESDAPPLRLAGLDAAKGKAAAPVAGRLSARYGQGGGVLSRGWVYQASEAAEVFAPYDGRVAYAGPFRGYGNVALIDHGDGYHTLLTGLGLLSVGAGDWVLQGEPLGALPKGAAGRGSGPGGPKLYVELRKDGKPVDPAPWFARPT